MPEVSFDQFEFDWEASRRVERRPPEQVDGIAKETPSPVMFWVLLGLAAAAFAPCCLVPVWRDYQAIRMAEQLEEGEVERLSTHVDRQRRHLDALRTDPAVVARTAQRDLGFRRPDESFVLVQSGAQPAPAATIPKPSPLDTQQATFVHAPLPQYASIFINPVTRNALMGLSAGLVIAAFVLYPPRREARR